MPRFKRLCLSISGTASVALASLPLAIGPASAGSLKGLSQASYASPFNLGSHRAQGSSTELVGQTKNLQPIASIPTPIGESAGGENQWVAGDGGVDDSCPEGTVAVVVQSEVVLGRRSLRCVDVPSGSHSSQKQPQPVKVYMTGNAYECTYLWDCTGRDWYYKR